MCISYHFYTLNFVKNEWKWNWMSTLASNEHPHKHSNILLHGKFYAAPFLTQFFFFQNKIIPFNTSRINIIQFMVLFVFYVHLLLFLSLYFSLCFWNIYSNYFLHIILFFFIFYIMTRQTWLSFLILRFPSTYAFLCHCPFSFEFNSFIIF